ncbi:MAG: hypothetical protein Q9163_003222 [Psora crenata]
MPLLGNGEYRDVIPKANKIALNEDAPKKPVSGRRQSQHSGMAKSAMSHCSAPNSDEPKTSDEGEEAKEQKPGGKIAANNNLSPSLNASKQPCLCNGMALSDTPTTTPTTTAPNSPVIPLRRQDSGTSTPSRQRAATTLDIPGLTRSKASPDGRIAQKDVGSKLVIVMVGLPARGKSYVTKKVARYLNWLQHDTKIFNVGERRRIVVGGPASCSHTDQKQAPCDYNTAAASRNYPLHDKNMLTPPTSPSTRILVNGDLPPETPPLERLPPAAMDISDDEHSADEGRKRLGSTETCEKPEPLGKSTQTGYEESIEQSASFFDPNNERAACIRERVAMETLDELLEYILEKGGSVGILDATNSTLERRKAIVEKVRQRAGPDLGILFLESLCIDENLLESNMRLKLSGPDYKDQDPVTALADFKKRVALYEQKYVPLGDYEEKNNMPYVQMIDVGRKVVSHQIRGFLSAQTVYYLLNFNLAPRQIWITRHGESIDNVKGKIGGDSDLSERGEAYARALTSFITHQRQAWEVHQHQKALSTHFPPQPGDTTPPNPEYTTCSEHEQSAPKNFCVWTSMLKRSIQTAQYFDEEEFDIKQMKMLDELNAGIMEGLTYDEIKEKHAFEYEVRKRDKLHYRYPGAGGEGYLDIINRLRAVIVEVERMTDHVLLVGHRSVARVLLAYFKGLKREEVADLDVPLGVLYMLEPKPYGVEFKAYRYNAETEWFDLIPEYELRREVSQTAA